MGEISALCAAHGGVLRTGPDRQWRDKLAYLARVGRLRRVLPGVYVDASVEPSVLLRARAAMAADPNAVVTGRAAAALSFWPQLPVPAVDVAQHRKRGLWPGFRFSGRAIPIEHIIEHADIRLTAPAFTAVELAGSMQDGEPLDQALRTRAARVPELTAALAAAPNQKGNSARRLLVADSRFGAFSKFERRAHQLLRVNGITEWVANRPLQLGARWFLPDVRFRRRKLILEFDGYEFHSSPEAFLNDRVRLREFTAAGYRVLVFTWACLDDEAAFIRVVRRALRIADPV